MSTEVAAKVLEVLSATEGPPKAAALIEGMGTEAVTVVCETALGTYPVPRQKIRMNAAALVGAMKHPQALETTTMLVADPDVDVAVRAIRAAAHYRNDQALAAVRELLQRPGTEPFVAAEAVVALRADSTPESRAALADYAAASSKALPHRTSPVVQSVLEGED